MTKINWGKRAGYYGVRWGAETKIVKADSAPEAVQAAFGCADATMDVVWLAKTKGEVSSKAKVSKILSRTCWTHFG